MRAVVFMLLTASCSAVAHGADHGQHEASVACSSLSHVRHHLKETQCD
jgi:hypothetical protein